jgi:hypothetical protein
VGGNAGAQQQLLNALHSSPLVCHSRCPVTYHKVKKLFSWSKLKASVLSPFMECVDKIKS